MKVPCCSVCQTRYNEDERVPLLLQCGHGFCRECLYKMFSQSVDTTLTCPRCRHVSTVGNSVTALRKNYAILALIHSNNGSDSANFDFDSTDDDEEDGEDGADGGDLPRGGTSSSSGCGPVIELGTHPELKLVRRIGDGRRAGVEVWAAVLSGGGSSGGGGGRRRCRHRVAVKKVAVGKESSMDAEWMLGELESLRRMSMWCRNVCTFHGVVRNEEGSLSLVMDRCYGSVQSEMQRKGRLTLEQILRFFLTLKKLTYPFSLTEQ